MTIGNMANYASMNLPEESVISEYVVISNEEVNQLGICANEEVESVSDVKAMTIMLRDEVIHFSRYFYTITLQLYKNILNNTSMWYIK